MILPKVYIIYNLEQSKNVYLYKIGPKTDP